jgi:hypothetical protein
MMTATPAGRRYGPAETTLWGSETLLWLRPAPFAYTPVVMRPGDTR